MPGRLAGDAIGIVALVVVANLGVLVGGGGWWFLAAASGELLLIGLVLLASLYVRP